MTKEIFTFMIEIYIVPILTMFVKKKRHNIDPMLFKLYKKKYGNMEKHEWIFLKIYLNIRKKYT